MLIGKMIGTVMHVRDEQVESAPVEEQQVEVLETASR